MFLFKIWIFEIDFGLIMSFLFGLVIGIVLLALIYSILVVLSLSNKKYRVITEDDSLSQSEAKQMIIDAQKSFKDKSLKGDTPRFTHCMNLCKDLLYGISSRFYPKSKFPMYELSVDEAVMLIGYIQNRIDEILNNKVLKVLRRLKISKLVSLTLTATHVADSKAFEVGKDISKTAGKINKVLKVINPLWWARKLVVDKALSLALNKLCVLIIGIVGEETYKIYSKKIFEAEVELDSNVDEILEELNNEVKGITNELEVVDTPINIDLKLKRKICVFSEKKNNYSSIFDERMKLKKIKELVDA